MCFTVFTRTTFYSDHLLLGAERQEVKGRHSGESNKSICVDYLLEIAVCLLSRMEELSYATSTKLTTTL